MRFNVTVPVKPYVKRFLENNYGIPVNFKNHPCENEMFKRMLKKPVYDQEHKIQIEMYQYLESVEILISDREFYRYGWELSRTDIVNFGRSFAQRAKLQMRSIVGQYVLFGMPVNIAIKKFQVKFGYEEEYWPFESLLKDFSRFRKKFELDSNKEAYEYLEHLTLYNLKSSGVITDKVVKEHNAGMVEI